MKLRILVRHKPTVGALRGETVFTPQFRELWWWRGFTDDVGLAADFRFIEQAIAFLDRVYQDRMPGCTAVVDYQPKMGTVTHDH